MTQWCKENEEVISTRADKDNVTVAMELLLYNHKVQELLSPFQCEHRNRLIS